MTQYAATYGPKNFQAIFSLASYRPEFELKPDFFIFRTIMFDSCQRVFGAYPYNCTQQNLSQKIKSTSIKSSPDFSYKSLLNRYTIPTVVFYVSPQHAKPWEDYDLMLKYRQTVNEDEERSIMSEVFKENSLIEGQRKSSRTVLKRKK